MSTKFKPGVRVTEKFNGPLNDNFQDPNFGTVIDKLASQGKVFVQWEKRWDNDSDRLNEVNVKDLLLESEAKDKLSELEKEYQELENQILPKMKEIAKLIKESNKLAKKGGYESLSEMYEVTGNLYHAMDQAGWNTSSWGC